MGQECPCVSAEAQAASHPSHMTFSTPGAPRQCHSDSRARLPRGASPWRDPPSTGHSCPGAPCWPSQPGLLKTTLSLIPQKSRGRQRLRQAVPESDLSGDEGPSCPASPEGSWALTSHSSPDSCRFSRQQRKSCREKAESRQCRAGMCDSWVSADSPLLPSAHAPLGQQPVWTATQPRPAQKGDVPSLFGATGCMRCRQ